MAIEHAEWPRKKRQRRDTVKEQLWRQRLDEQKKSDLSIVDYCRRDGISRASFHWWKKEIQKRNEEKKKPGDNAFQKSNETSQAQENTPFNRSGPANPTRKSLPGSKKNIETPKQQNGQIPPAEKSTDIDRAPAFAEIRFTPTIKSETREDISATVSSKPAGIDVVLNSGRLIRIRSRSDIDLMLAVADALEGAAPC